MDGFERPILGQLHDEEILEELFVAIIGIGVDRASLRAFADGLDRESVAVAGEGVNVFGAGRGELQFGQSRSLAKVLDGQLFPDRPHRIGDSPFAHLGTKAGAEK